MKSPLAALAALALAGCAVQEPAPAAPEAPLRVVVAATTDLHGWIEGRTYPPPAGVVPVRTGGLDVLAAYVETLRRQSPGRVALVDSGDLFQGTLVSNLYEGEPVVEAYDAIGFDAAAVGNHEFDYGPVGAAVLPRTDADDPLGALKRNAAQAKFPFLGANILEKDSGRRPDWLKPSLLLPLRGAKLGVIGLASPLTPTTTVEENVRGLLFTDPAPAVIAEAAALRAAGADAIVVAAHMGAVCRDEHDVATCDADSEIVQLARAVPRGTVDAYFAGHTHRANLLDVDGVPVLQPLPFGQGLAVLELTIDPRAHRATAAHGRVVEVCERVYEKAGGCDARRATAGEALVPATFEGARVTAVPRVTALLAPWTAKVEARRNAKLGFRITAPFTRDYNRESALGDLVADALLEGTPGADVAITNAGGLRADLRATEPTYGDLYEILPFDNLVATIRVTGAELRELLGRTGEEGHGSHQVSGLRVQVDAARPPGAGRVLSATLRDGTALRDDATYTVVTNDFLARGGGNFGSLIRALPPDRVRMSDRLMRDLVIAELERRGRSGPLTPGLDGRLTVIGGPPPEGQTH